MNAKYTKSLNNFLDESETAMQYLDVPWMKQRKNFIRTPWSSTEWTRLSGSYRARTAAA